MGYEAEVGDVERGVSIKLVNQIQDCTRLQPELGVRSGEVRST